MEAMHLHIPVAMKSASAAPVKEDAENVNVLPVENIEVND